MKFPRIKIISRPCFLNMLSFHYPFKKSCLFAFISVIFTIANANATSASAQNSSFISKNKTPIIARAEPLYSQGQQLYDQYPWAVLYYYGITASDSLGQMFQGQFHRWLEHIQTLELTHTLSEDNLLRRLVNPLVGIVQVSANVTMRNGSDQHRIYEFSPYVEGRWANFPWNHFINTSFAIGEGISYASSVPSLENQSSENTKRLLNYLLLEATFAPPSYPRLQLVIRIHHRSGAYGLYHAGNTGSNNIGLGIRYLFD